MATVVPNGVVRVCKGVPLSNDYKHTLWFKNDSLFFDYFESKVAKTFSRYNIIRDTDAISVEATYDEACTWNYMYFQNNGTGGSHIYFAFITRVEYVNENTVKLHYEIDVLMSYYWSYTLNQCFVEREHSATDNYYDNLIDEGLDVGEYVDQVTTYPELGELCVLVLSNVAFKDDNTIGGRSQGMWMNKQYTSMYVYAFTMQGSNALDTILGKLDEGGKADAILGMWMYPKHLIRIAGADWSSEKANLVVGVNRISETIIPAVNFSGYNPKNNKLFSYPYNYIYVSNNAGGSAVYKHELVKDNLPQSSLNNIEFLIGGAISPESSVRLYPSYYRKKGNNFEEGISLGTYPSCAWNSDTYKLWLAQNQNQLDHQMNSINATVVSTGVAGLMTAIGGVAALLAAPATGGASAMAGAAISGGLMTMGGGVLSGVNQVNSVLAQKADMSLQPPNSRGSYTANINVNEGYQTFTISRRTITKEHAMMIDEYFTRFGYACRRFKVPNRHARKSFTYVKTVDCQITANLSHDIIQKIESIYDNGVTIWADPSVIGVYTCDNSCL